MILEIVCLVIGVIIFLIGVLKFINSKKNGNAKERKKYGLIAYLGFTVMMIASILLMGSLVKQINSFIMIFVVLGLFSLAGRFLLDSGSKRK